jgi:hypothetical protein
MSNTNAAGTPTMPVPEYAATIPPASTVIGADADTEKKNNPRPVNVARSSPTGAAANRPARLTRPPPLRP